MTPDEGRTRVMLSGYYGCGNLGDDLLLTVAVEELRTILPGARFLLRDHGADLPLLGPDVIPTGVDAILDDRASSRLSRLTRFIWRIAGLLRQCHWLVFGGGTVFHDTGGLASLTLQWLICHLARVLGVRVAALGVGIGDLRTGTARRLLRGIIARSELFMVRDEAALRQCTNTKARLTADLVFAWQAMRPADTRPRPDHGSLCIGLTVTPAAGEQTRTALADAIRIWREYGHRVIFLVFQRNAATADDTAMADDTAVFADIERRLGAAAMPVEIRRPGADAAGIAQAFADIDIVCGMRFHGLVLAAMLGSPFVGIVHDNKISEICRHFGMPRHDAASLDGAELAASTEDVREKVPDSRLVHQSGELAKVNFLAFASLSS